MILDVAQLSVCVMHDLIDVNEIDAQFKLNETKKFIVLSLNPTFELKYVSCPKVSLFGLHTTIGMLLMYLLNLILFLYGFCS